MSIELLSRTLHQLMQTYKAQLQAEIKQQKIGLPVTLIRVLKSVRHIPECTAQCIAKRMSRDKAQITRALNQLLSSGLIDKKSNPNDRRSQILVPTPAGQDLLSQIDVIQHKVASQLTQNLTAQEVEQFLHLASSIINSVNED